MRGPIQQTWHVLHEIGFYLASLFSRTINASFYGGSMHQTLSARAHIEARTSPRWQQIERRINRLFFWQEDHCKQAWDSEVGRAWKTIARNGDVY
jgi:hypothetical protein